MSLVNERRRRKQLRPLRLHKMFMRPGIQFTAANNNLPIGTRVRVTHLKNGKSVVVRITDRGITKPKIKLDLCKEAAEELNMVGEGVAHVRMQGLDDGKGSPSS